MIVMQLPPVPGVSMCGMVEYMMPVDGLLRLFHWHEKVACSKKVKPTCLDAGPEARVEPPAPDRISRSHRVVKHESSLVLCTESRRATNE